MVEYYSLRHPSYVDVVDLMKKEVPSHELSSGSRDPRETLARSSVVHTLKQRLTPSSGTHTMALNTSRPLFWPLSRLHLLSLREHVATCSSRVRSGFAQSHCARSLSVANGALPQPSQLLVQKLNSKQRRQISAFIDLLLDWNKVRNSLTS